MPADLNLSRIQQWLANFEGHEGDLFSPMPLEDLAAARADLTARLWEIGPTALRRAFSEPTRIEAARQDGRQAGYREGVEATHARVRAILNNDRECCGRPDTREIYSYDENGNATGIIGVEPDGCCGCPIQRAPADILAEVAAALSPAPAEPTWTPTHRHYKGTLYRVTKRGKRIWAGNDDRNGALVVEYDNEAGGEFALAAVDFDSEVEDGVRRYAPLSAKPAEPSAPVALTRCQAASLRNDGECWHKLCPVPREITVSRLHCTLPGGGPDDYDEDDLPASAPVAEGE